VPKSITIRDVPDATAAELAARAAASGRSLQAYLRARLVEMAQQPDVETVLGAIRARKGSSKTRLTPEQILAYRDVDRP
jgi:plasmid stability protein